MASDMSLGAVMRAWGNAERWDQMPDGRWRSRRTGQVIRHGTMLEALRLSGQVYGGRDTAFLPDGDEGEIV